MRNILNDDDMKNVIERYLNGEKIIDIAADYDMSPDSVRINLRKNGIGDRRKYYCGYTEEECKDIIQLYLSNKWNEIFEKYPNMNKQKVYSLSSKLGYRKESYFWTQEDTDWLVKNYKTASKKEIQDRYQGVHSYSAIREKAIKMGLTEPQEWSAEEDTIFRENYSNIPINELLEMLPKRTYNSLICHGRKLGITSYNHINEKYTDEQREFIRSNFGIMTDEEIAEAIGKNTIGVQEQRRRMGLYIIAKDYTGYENLSKFLRGHIQTWKTKSIEACNYQCVLTGSKDFIIHHIYSFNKIFAEAMSILSEQGYKISNIINDYRKDELEYILEIFRSVHDQYPLGVCLRKDLHDLFHELYGSGNNNEFQWNQFVERYKSGEFTTLK